MEFGWIEEKLGLLQVEMQMENYRLKSEQSKLELGTEDSPNDMYMST
jgi:hypothetical protein